MFSEPSAILRGVQTGLRRPRGRLTVLFSIGFLVAIGVCGAILGSALAYRVLLRPLPLHDPDQVVLFNRSPIEFDRGPKIWPEVSNVPSFAALGLFQTGGINLGSDPPRRVRVAAVDAGFFAVCGIVPQHGRTLLRSEDSRARVVILSEELWRLSFGSKPILDSMIDLNSERFLVVGVMPPGFRFPNNTDLWIPAGSVPQISAGIDRSQVFGRLEPHSSIPQAEQSVREAYKRTVGAAVVSRLSGQFLSPLGGRIAAAARPVALLVFGLCSLLFVATCISASLLGLSRLPARQAEFEMRRALGAEPLELASQVVSEVLLPTVIGGAVGSVLSIAGGRMVDLRTADLLPERLGIAIDGRHLTLTAATLLLSLAAIAAPQLLAILKRNIDGLRSRATFGPTAVRIGHALLVVQLAVCTILLVVSLAGERTLRSLGSVTLGFERDDAICVDLTLPTARYKSSQEIARFADDLANVLASSARVSHVGIGTLRPGGSLARQDFLSLNAALGPGVAVNTVPRAALIGVTDGFLDALGVKWLYGQGFKSSTGRPVVILSDSAVSALGLTVPEAVGRFLPIHFQLSPGIGWRALILAEIVGVVESVRFEGPEGNTLPQIYQPIGQVTQWIPTDLSLVLMTDTPSEARSLVGSAVSSIDKSIPPRGFMSLASVRGFFLWKERLAVSAAAIFFAAVVLLSGVVVLAVLDQQVAMRGPEISIRLALGATPSMIRNLVALSAIRTAGLGILVGITALCTVRILFPEGAGLLPRFRGIDLLVASILLLAWSALAAWLPADRASRLSPLEVVRAP